MSNITDGDLVMLKNIISDNFILIPKTDFKQIRDFIHNDVEKCKSFCVSDYKKRGLEGGSEVAFILGALEYLLKYNGKERDNKINEILQ